MCFTSILNSITSNIKDYPPTGEIKYIRRHLQRSVIPITFYIIELNISSIFEVDIALLLC